MKALDLRPTDGETWNSLGVVLVRQGQAARGVDAFNHALHLNPDHLEAHRNLAVTLDRQGRSGEAAAHYRAFLRLTQEDHPARDDVRRRLLDVSTAGGNPE
jgi:cytochrome c-type biogenesis protein CcmH/NrfG